MVTINKLIQVLKVSFIDQQQNGRLGNQKPKIYLFLDIGCTSQTWSGWELWTKYIIQ